MANQQHFRPCVIIPCYNYIGCMPETLAKIAEYQVDCFVIDDGNEAPKLAQLHSMVANYTNARLHSLEKNGGKGAAILKGCTLALAAGYSHALQVDADGQHDLNQLGQFLKTAEQHPEALICGVPRYDTTAPLGRLFARYLTHFWVMVETLSFSTPDSMCGYRVYPLDKSCDLFARVSIGQRMDFDIEVLVRMIWERVPVVIIPTKVTYPKEGESNFKYIRDNVLISVLHIRLVVGMLLRFPLLLRHRPSIKRVETDHWSTIHELGSRKGIQFLLWNYRVFGRIPFELLLVPVITYFFLTAAKPRRASMKYLQKVYLKGGIPKKPSWCTSFRHFLEFGRFSLDRVSSWMGKVRPEDVRFEQRPLLARIAQSGKGVLIVGSHLGNIEMCRALSSYMPGVTFTILVYTEHANKFNSVLREVNPELEKMVLSVKEIDPSTGVALKERIDRGEILVILGDRTPVHSRRRVSHVNFLGEKAPFSQGPFILAHLLECPVLFMCCLKENSSYEVYLEQFAERIVLDRKGREQQLETIIQRYAAILEKHCLQKPMQWFNFYDYWPNSLVDAV